MRYPVLLAAVSLGEVFIVSIIGKLRYRAAYAGACPWKRSPSSSSRRPCRRSC